MSTGSKYEQGLYPELVVNLGRIEANTRAVASLCNKYGINLTCVVKGAGGLPEVAQAMARGGCTQLASSRLGQLARLREYGLNLPLMLLRIPGLSELDRVVKNANLSLQSDVTILRASSDAAERAGLRHGVLLMQDLGDRKSVV